MTDSLGISRRQALKYSGLAAAVPLLPVMRRDAAKPLLLWAGQQQVPPPVASTAEPALAVFNGLLYMAWHGGPNDDSLWWSNAS